MKKLRILITIFSILIVIQISSCSNDDSEAFPSDIALNYVKFPLAAAAPVYAKVILENSNDLITQKMSFYYGSELDEEVLETMTVTFNYGDNGQLESFDISFLNNRELRTTFVYRNNRIEEALVQGINSVRSYTFRYDDMNRLIQYDNSRIVYDFEYDENSNVILLGINSSFNNMKIFESYDDNINPLAELKIPKAALMPIWDYVKTNDFLLRASTLSQNNVFSDYNLYRDDSRPTEIYEFIEYSYHY